MCAVGVCSILVRKLATPFHRGFFKDDQSLMRPFKESTVPVSVLYGVGFSLPTLAVSVCCVLVVKSFHSFIGAFNFSLLFFLGAV